MRWAEETGADPARVEAAVRFLKTDIAGVSGEFDLLATGILDDVDEPAPTGITISRSIPIQVRA